MGSYDLFWESFRLYFVCFCHCTAQQAETWHLRPHHARHDGALVQTYPHLHVQRCRLLQQLLRKPQQMRSVLLPARASEAVAKRAIILLGVTCVRLAPLQPQAGRSHVTIPYRFYLVHIILAQVRIECGIQTVEHAHHLTRPQRLC